MLLRTILPLKHFHVAKITLNYSIRALFSKFHKFFTIFFQNLNLKILEFEKRKKNLVNNNNNLKISR